MAIEIPRIDEPREKAIDKKRVLEWFMRTVIDDPNVEVVCYGSSMYYADPGADKARFDPKEAYVKLRQKEESDGDGI